MVATEKECRFQIGEFCFSLNFAADAVYISSVKNYFSPFLSEKDPDIYIYCEIVFSREEVFVPASLHISKTVEGNTFNYQSGLIYGNLDMQKKKCFIKVNNALLGNPSVRIFEQFFHQLYYTLLEHKYAGRMPDQFLVHSSGVVKNGKGYVFVGPSGSGKSTIAELSAEYDILNDEITLIKKTKNKYTAHATPFNGYFRLKKNISCPLKAFLFIKQDSLNYIQRVTVKDCVIPFAREMIPPISVLSEEKGRPLSLMVDRAVTVLSEVPFFELHFIKNKNFWDCIDALN